MNPIVGSDLIWGGVDSIDRDFVFELAPNSSQFPAISAHCQSEMREPQ
jgi:hypothetical protein